MQKSVKIKPKGSILRKKYSAGGFNTFKSHNSTSTCRSEKRFSAFYSQSNSISDNISLTLKLKNLCNPILWRQPLWRHLCQTNLKLPGQQSTYCQEMKRNAKDTSGGQKWPIFPQWDNFKRKQVMSRRARPVSRVGSHTLY